ncbi:MAG: NAD(P)/FAD-dependent oxidoreductase [Luteolibacter sp.]
MQTKQPNSGTPWLIVGQGLAGTCLAWEFLERGISFHISDKGTGGSTRVAAGLINPITGKNFQPSWRIGEFHPEAIAFFKSIEQKLSVRIWHPLPILRLASSEKEWKKIQGKLNNPETKPWLKSISLSVPENFTGAVELTGGGRIDTALFIEASAIYFQKYGIHSISEQDTSLPHPRRILCEGAAGLLHDQLGTHRCAKGEIITVSAPWPETHIRIGAGGWLVPIGDNTFRIGSTYEWNQLDESPTQPGLERITEIANKLGGPEFEITDHVAGIRPILRRSQPLIGKNKTGDWIFNALGSKGTLYAPRIATMLADWIENDTPPEDDFILSLD